MTPTSNKKPALTFIVKSVHRRRHPSIHLHQLRHARTPTRVTHPPQGTALIHEPTREETCHGVMPRTAVAHSASQHKAWELRLAPGGGREPPKKTAFTQSVTVSGEVCLCSHVVPMGWVSGTSVIQHLHHRLLSTPLARSRRLEPAAEILGLAV